MAALQDEPRDYIEKQFKQKNELLSVYGCQVSAVSFYEDMFGVDNMETQFPIVIIGEDEEKHIVPMPLCMAIEQAEHRNDMLLGSCTYFNNWISKRSAEDVYGFIIDADNFYSGTLRKALQNEWRTASNESMPMPTYIVNSGTGLHLYYLFSEAIPNYNLNRSIIDKVYRMLAVQQTTKRVYLQRQVQWFGQNFRMAGGLNKYGWKNSVYAIGRKWDFDELARAVGLKDVHARRYGEIPPHKKERSIRPKTNRKGWRSNKAFYEYALKQCKNKTRQGNRYKSMCALVTIAWKCNISAERLQHDLKQLLPIYNKDTKNIVKESEIKSAMKMYNERAMQTPRSILQDWQGWEYKPIKRNGRKRDVHLRIARGTLEVLNNENGKPLQGRPNARNKVEQWQAQNPKGTKAACIRETGLTKPTVYKYWQSSAETTQPIIAEEQTAAAAPGDGIQAGAVTDESKQRSLKEIERSIKKHQREMERNMQAMVQSMNVFKSTLDAMAEGPEKEKMRKDYETIKVVYDVIMGLNE